MPTEFEDTVAGATTDISGTPPPSTPRELHANTNRATHGASSPPKPAPQKTAEAPDQQEPPAEAPTEPQNGAASSARSVDPNMLHALAQTAKHANPLTGFDISGMNSADAWATAKHVSDHLGAFMSGTGLGELPLDAVKHVESVYGAAIDPHAISASVQNVWAQNSAQAEVAKFLLSGGQSAFHPGRSDAQVRDQTAGVMSAALSTGANPLNAVGMGEANAAYRVAAFAGPSVLQALASSDPNEQHSALVWAAMTAMLVGRVPEPVRKELVGAFEKWPELERALGAIKSAKGSFNRKAAAGDGEHLGDVVQHYLDQGTIGYSRDILKAARTRTPGGELIQKTSPRLQKALLAKAGVGSMAQFIDKARTDGITDKRVLKFVVENYPRLGFDHDLYRVKPGEVNYGDPRHSLQDIHKLGDSGRTGWALDAMNSFTHVLEHVRRGLWAEAQDGHLAILKNIAGHNRTGGSTDVAVNRWLQSVDHLRQQHKLDGVEIAKAVWGDEKAFEALPPEGQLIARQWGLLRNALRTESNGVGRPRDFVGNWLPLIRREADATRPTTRSGALTTQAARHKVEALKADDEGHLDAQPAYLNADEANAAQKIRRAELVNELMTPTIPLRKELALTAKPYTDLASPAGIRQLSVTNPDEAYKQARAFAERHYGDFENDFFAILANPKWRNQLKAIRTHEALGHLSESTAKDGNPLAVRATTSRRVNIYRGLNYDGLPGRQFEGWLFHPDIAADMKRYVERPEGLDKAPGLKQARKAESFLVHATMYSPLLHGMNMAARFGAGVLSNPFEFLHLLTEGVPLTPAQRDAVANRFREQAIEWGGVPETRGKSYFDNLSGRLDAALGHVDEELGTTAPKAAHDMWGGYQHYRKAVNDYFWAQVRDFSVLMTHLEYRAARRHGFSETDARLWAGQRGKTWAGLVNPEDQNAVLHDAARLVMFAPEWWKSLGQLLVPVYTKSGMSRQHAGWAAYQGVKTLAAMWLLQKVSGNLVNYFLTSSSPFAADGHFQDQNLPGNQDRIEATAPWLNGLPGFNMVAPEDAKTGGRRTLENPLGRQMRDLEAVAGLESGQKGTALNALQHPEDVHDGLSKVAAARLSPILDGAAGAMNMDLYRTLLTGQWEHVDPSQPGGPSLASPLYAALMMTPLGSQWAEQMAQSASDPNALQSTPGPFGATVPKAAAQMLPSTGAAVERLLLSWLTGVNPPYSIAQKSRGTPISDQQYQQYQRAKTTYTTHMQQWDALALSGQLTPQQWLDHYRQEHGAYSAIARSTFQDAPHYVNGAEGMLNAYEALADERANQNPDGSVNYDALRHAQAEFRTHYTAAQLAAMDQLLHQRDTQMPMLALYHRTLDEYGKWQATWAAQHNIDLATLHSEIAEYGALHGDARAQAQYRAHHRELSRYLNQKARWEYTPAGLMYSLLYNPGRATAYMQAKHITFQQVVQAEEAQ